jgi:hypothetical protein
LVVPTGCAVTPNAGLGEDALRVGELQVLRRGEGRGGRDPGARRAEERPELLDARGDRLLRRAGAEGTNGDPAAPG